jgi:hypothetical protein
LGGSTMNGVNGSDCLINESEKMSSLVAKLKASGPSVDRSASSSWAEDMLTHS